MGNECKLSSAEQRRLEDSGYAKDTVKYGVHTQREVDDCVSGGQTSRFDQLKGMLAGAFSRATAGVEQGVRAGAELAASGVTQNTGLSGRAADALQNRGEQLRRMEAAMNP